MSVIFTKHQLFAESNKEALLAPLGQEFIFIKNLLTCDPNKLFNLISQIQKFQKQAWDCYDQLEETKLRQYRYLLNLQFKRVIEWQVDHLELFQNIININSSFKINIQTLYKTFILHKVQNGLQYIKILETLEHISAQSVKQKADIEQIRRYVKSLQDGIEATFSDQASKSQEDENIYWKRYAALDPRQKIYYRLKLVQILQNSREASFCQTQEFQDQIEECMQSTDCFIKQTQDAQLFQLLMQVFCQLTKEYEEKIINAKLLLIEGENARVVLGKIDKLENKLITGKVLRLVLKKYQFAINALAAGNLLHFNGGIYLKFAITQMIIEPQCSTSADQSLNDSDFQWNNDHVKNAFNETIDNFKILMQALTKGQNFFAFESDNFTPILASQSLLFGLRTILKINNLEQLDQIKKTVDQLFSEPELIDIFTDVLQFIDQQRQQQCKRSFQIFKLTCSILGQVDFDRQQKMLKLSEFCNFFMGNLNKVLQHDNITTFIAIEPLLIRLVTKVPPQKTNVQCVNLQRICEMKYRAVIKSNAKNCTLDDFIKAFPDSQRPLNQRLLEGLKTEINGFLTDEMPSKDQSEIFDYILKRVDNNEKLISRDIKDMLWVIIIKHPCIFDVKSTHIERSKIEIVLSVQKQALRLEFSKSYDQLMSIAAQKQKSIPQKLNTVSRLTILLSIQKNIYTHQLAPRSTKLLSLELTTTKTIKKRDEGGTLIRIWVLYRT